ncbi:MAG: glycosyltransferase family 2 protein [Elusimicrobia bacterium]|nr:glycosyltransferase family 2 protein [Elusimicrobiota bacterium]
MKVSVLIPAYNEARTIAACLEAVYGRNPGRDLEVIVVDDGSTDGTYEAAKAAARPGTVVLKHDKNSGKGTAIRTALDKASGEVVLIQDADLEYDPADYARLLEPIESGRAAVVYGSRHLAAGNRRSYARYYYGGRLVSVFTNLLYGSSITDEPTCYKVFKTSLLRSFDLKCTGFEFCPEATAKTLLRGIPILEVPISYRPRRIEEGKKIRWYDGIEALWTLLRLRWTRV